MSAYSALLVDDSRLARLVFRGRLETLGFRVEEASSGTEALGLLKSNGSWDLFLVDHFMPGMEGPELVKELRRRDVQARVVLCSATIDEALCRDVEGIDAFLPKPGRPGELEETIRELGFAV